MGPDLRSVLLLGAWFLVIWIDSTFNRITLAHLSRIASTPSSPRVGRPIGELVADRVQQAPSLESECQEKAPDFDKGVA